MFGYIGLSPFPPPPVTTVLAGRWQLPTGRRGDNPAAARLTLHLPPSLLGWETFSHTASRRPRPSRNAQQRRRGLYLPSPPQSCCPAVTGPASGFCSNIQSIAAGHWVWKRLHSSVVVFCLPWNPEYVIWACFASVTSLVELRVNCPLRWAVNQKFATRRCNVFIFRVVLPVRFLIQKHKDWRQVQQFHERAPEYFVYLPSDIKVEIHCVNHHKRRKLHL